MAVKMSISFRIVMPSGRHCYYERFEGIYCLDLKG
jgi:hypothetical protein